MKRVCNNGECGWEGETEIMCGSVGPLCPSCHETTTPAGWTNSKMNPWVPDSNPFQNRRLSKTGEEVNELGAVLFRIANQGIDGIDPSSGKTNRQRLLEETADVLAQFDCNMRGLFTVEERHFLNARVCEKVRQMAEWEAHYLPGES